MADLQQAIQNTQSPMIMGVINVTPDSFSDGGQFNQLDMALKQAERMLQQGAVILDIGGESTRPGADKVSSDEELARVLPIIAAIKSEFGCWVSIDTSKTRVMEAAIEAGADLINDVTALSDAGAVEFAVHANVPVCLMHMQGRPDTMQNNPTYNNVVEEVSDYLVRRAQLCIDKGMDKSNIVIDPGFGFGKTQINNFTMLDKFEQFCDLGYPVLAGLSRKTMLGWATGKAVNERIVASAAGAMICAQKGATMIRVHDVSETSDVLKILAAMQQQLENNNE